MFDQARFAKASIGSGDAETAIPGAPRILIGGGKSCVPQQFLEYCHTLESVEDILSEITFDEDYVRFVSEDATGLYVQIGIIGKDNYRRSLPPGSNKIVYGRKWRVERNLPTSEIIQTVFLALKTAREHEVRERFVVEWNGSKTTPFNCHHDLPLMADIGRELKRSAAAENDFRSVASNVSFFGGSFSVERVSRYRDDLWIVDLNYENSGTEKVEFSCEPKFSIFVRSLSISRFLHALMSELVRQSDHYVAEVFTFRGFARFSHDVNVLAISELSALVRGRASASASERFKNKFQRSRYDTDETRVPKLTDSQYARSILTRLSDRNISDGILPKIQPRTLTKVTGLTP